MDANIKRSIALFFALIAACAAAEANKRKTGKLQGGRFELSQAGSVNYGADPSRTCRPGLPELTLRAVKDAGVTAALDGRLCAAGESLLALADGEMPSRLRPFVAESFGIPAPLLVVDIMTFKTDDEKVIAPALADAIKQYATRVPTPIFGVADERLEDKTAVRRAGSIPSQVTHVVLVVQDASLELNPLPRKLALGASAPLSGQVNGNFQNLRLSVSDAEGRMVDTPKIQANQPFSVPLPCGDKPGTLRVELRGEKDGNPSYLAKLPVACGAELATSVVLETSVAGAGPGAAAGGPPEASMLAQINADRTGAGLKPLEQDPALEAVAKEQAEAAATGTPSSTEQLIASLHKAGLDSPVVLQNPAMAHGPSEAQEMFSSSPVNRGIYMNKSITHAGIGVVQAKDKAGKDVVYVSELFVQKAGKIDASVVRQQVRKAVAEKRATAGVAPIGDDKALDDVAQEYAKQLAAAGGKLERSKGDVLLRPLYARFSKVDFISGQTPDPTAFAADPSMLSKTQFLGIGVAQGPSGVFAVFIFGNRK